MEILHHFLLGENSGGCSLNPLNLRNQTFNIHGPEWA